MKIKFETYKTSDEYEARNGSEKMNTVNVVTEYGKFNADMETECKKAVTAVKRFFSVMPENECLDGWKAEMMENARTGEFMEMSEPDAGFSYCIEEVDDGIWYVSLVLAAGYVENAEQETAKEETTTEPEQTDAPAEVEQTANQEATETVEQKTTVESKIFKFFFADYKTFEAGDKNSGLQVNPAIEQGSQRYVKIVFGDILGCAYDYQLNTAGITPNEIREACAENLLKHEECNSWQARKKGQTHLYYITKKGIKALYNAYKGQW